MNIKLNHHLSKSVFTGLAMVALLAPASLHNPVAQADTTSSNAETGTNDSTNDSMSIGAIQQAQQKLDDQSRLTNAKNKSTTDQEQSREIEQDIKASASNGSLDANDSDQKVAQDSAQDQSNKDQAQINDAQNKLNEDNGVTTNNDSNGTAYPTSSENAPGLISFPDAPTTSPSPSGTHKASHHLKNHKRPKLAQKFTKAKHAMKHKSNHGKITKK